MNPKLWDNTLYLLRDRLDTHQFNHWFKPIVCESVTDDAIVLKVPDQFFQEWLKDNYIDVLQACLSQEGGASREIRFTHNDGPASTQVGTDPESNEHQTRGHALGPAGEPFWDKAATKSLSASTSTIPINPQYTFDTFVVGASNQFAHAACAAVAEAPGRNYNPLFIYGGVGLGKTHLLHAIGNEILATNPSANIQYISSEDYINDLITSLNTKRMDEFRSRYRKSCDVLLVDDIQFIAGKERTQIEFFHTFNSLYAEHKQIVVTSDRFPQEISGLEERLKSRFQWGLIADVQPPEFETRVAILQAKATAEGTDLPEDVAMFLAQNIQKNVRELEGCLIRLAAHSRLTRVPIDLKMTQQVLRDILRSPGPTITIPQIQKAVAGYFNVTVSDLKGARRHRAIALPRMIAMFLARQHTPCSFPEIGKRFGNRDHSTVISAVKKITRLSKDLDAAHEPVHRALRELERGLNLS